MHTQPRRSKDSHLEHRPSSSTHMLKQPQDDRRLAFFFTLELLLLLLLLWVVVQIILATFDRLEHDVGSAMKGDR